MSETYPLGSFYFQLSFSGVTDKAEASFKEASGISLERGTEEITEGGSPYVHRVPTYVKYPNLVLKRGMISANSKISKWCIDPVESLGIFPMNLESIETKTIIVKLLNESGTPIKSWSFFNAWPIKYAVSDLNSMENTIAVETLEFSYSYFQLL